MVVQNTREDITVPCTILVIVISNFVSLLIIVVNANYKQHNHYKKEEMVKSWVSSRT